jgi:hypothetical protein
VHGAVEAGWDAMLGVVRIGLGMHPGDAAGGGRCLRQGRVRCEEGAVDDGRARGEGGEGGLLQCTTRLCAGCDMRGRIGNTASKQVRQAALARPVEMVWSLDWGAEYAAVSENCCWLLDCWCWCWCFAAWRAVAMRCNGRAAACVSDYSSDALLPVPYYYSLRQEDAVCAGRVQRWRGCLLCCDAGA